MRKINDLTPGKRWPFERAQQQGWSPDVIDEDFWNIVEKAWDYTLLQAGPLYNYYSALRYVIERNIPGDVVECGVALGGSVMFAGEVLHAFEPRGSRFLYGLDTFDGFVRNTEAVDVDYDGNPVCVVTPERTSFLQAALDNIDSTSLDPERIRIVQGDVLHTISELPIEAISVLRLDTDTYDTTKFELESLYSKVVRGGVVIIDDYGWCLGCKKAVDEFAADKLILPMRVSDHCRSWVKVD